jgi:hypothetical protein
LGIPTWDELLGEPTPAFTIDMAISRVKEEALGYENGPACRNDDAQNRSCRRARANTAKKLAIRFETPEARSTAASAHCGRHG